MNTLDQVLLLEEKVESAVKKIQQLQAENDALRNECSELKNALAAKSEQLNTFETDQDKIEYGIQKALDRLNQIENSVIKTVGQGLTTPSTYQSTNTIQAEKPQEEKVKKNDIPVISMFKSEHPSTNAQEVQEVPSFDTMETMENEEESDEEPSEDLGFDIF